MQYNSKGKGDSHRARRAGLAATIALPTTEAVRVFAARRGTVTAGQLVVVAGPRTQLMAGRCLRDRA